MNDIVNPGIFAAIDRAIVRATQSGFPLVPRPYHVLAAAIGIAPALVMARLRAMQDDGRIRRIGVVPNHYALGYRANGMSVWDIADDRVDEIGERVGAMECVSHCYRRPRRLPQWRYNLFAMLHGRDRAEVESQVAAVAAVVADAARAHEVLYSTRILKKTGLRLGERATPRADKSAPTP